MSSAAPALEVDDLVCVDQTNWPQVWPLIFLPIFYFVSSLWSQRSSMRCRLHVSLQVGLGFGLFLLFLLGSEEPVCCCRVPWT